MISLHVEFKVKIENNPNKQITITTESFVPSSDLNFPKVCSKTLLDSRRGFKLQMQIYSIFYLGTNNTVGDYLCLSIFFCTFCGNF